MNKLLKRIGEYLYNFVFIIGCMCIFSYMVERWPRPYKIVMTCGLIGLTVWYTWKFFVVPFWQGLHRNEPRE